MAKCQRNMLAIKYEDGQKLNEFRDLVEETVAQRDIKVAIHVQPTPRKKPERQTDAIFIKKTAGASYLDVLKNVRDEVIAKGLGDVVRGVRETKGGDLMLTIDKQRQQKDIKEGLINKMGKENVRASSKKPEATVHIRDIDAMTTKEEVEAAVREELGDIGKTITVEVVSLRKTFAGTQRAMVNLAKEDECLLIGRKFIKIGLSCCRVKANTQVNTCFKCWLPGHNAYECKGNDRRKACKNCGKEGHIRKDCKEASYCVACDKVGHPTNTTRCQLFRKLLREQEMDNSTPAKNRIKPSGSKDTPSGPSQEGQKGGEE